MYVHGVPAVCWFKGKSHKILKCCLMRQSLILSNLLMLVTGPDTYDVHIMHTTLRVSRRGVALCGSINFQWSGLHTLWLGVWPYHFPVVLLKFYPLISFNLGMCTLLGTWLASKLLHMTVMTLSQDSLELYDWCCVHRLVFCSCSHNKYSINRDLFTCASLSHILPPPPPPYCLSLPLLRLHCP